MKRFPQPADVFFERPAVDAIQTATAHLAPALGISENTLQSGAERSNISRRKYFAVHSVRNQIRLASYLFRRNDGPAGIHYFIHNEREGLVHGRENEDVAKVKETQAIWDWF